MSTVLSLSSTGAILGMDTNTAIVVFVLALVLLFIFFVYLLLRRTAQGFKEGMQGER